MGRICCFYSTAAPTTPTVRTKLLDIYKYKQPVELCYNSFEITYYSYCYRMFSSSNTLRSIIIEEKIFNLKQLRGRNCKIIPFKMDP